MDPFIRLDNRLVNLNYVREIAADGSFFCYAEGKRVDVKSTASRAALLAAVQATVNGSPLPAALQSRRGAVPLPPMATIPVELGQVAMGSAQVPGSQPPMQA